MTELESDWKGRNPRIIIQAFSLIEESYKKNIMKQINKGRYFSTEGESLIPNPILNWNRITRGMNMGKVMCFIYMLGHIYRNLGNKQSDYM